MNNQGGKKIRPKATAHFYRRFNIECTDEDAKQHFVNRIISFVSSNYESLEDASFPTRADRDRNQKLLAIANELGGKYQPETTYSKYIANNFFRCLQALEALYKTLSPYNEERDEFQRRMESIISQGETDLGIRWRKGIFLPSGAKLLDEALVNENLQWLSGPKYKNVLGPFRKGLSDFLQAASQPERFKDTIRDMYEALEKMARVVCGNNRNLKANAELFVNMLGLNPHYSKMLKDYLEYAHEFRHAVGEGKERVLPSPQEAEAFIYTTGLFIRLAIEKSS